MSAKENKLLLTDCDGVLLEWEKTFHQYMHSLGHQRAYSNSYWQEESYPGLSQEQAQQMVYNFCTSAWMMDLPAFRDAEEGVARLANAGYRLHVITAMGTDPYAKQLRQINLDKLFGKGTVVELTTVDPYDPQAKRPVLTEYKDSGLFWIEDSWKNYCLGEELGLKSILLDHPHNQQHQDSQIKRVSSWSEICDKLL
jgi:FMN phosphatase YigB (HAD superfamily)